MSWLTKDFFTFFKELENNNTREWFHDNKELYEVAVKEPFYELVEDLIYRIIGEEPGFELDPKDAIFRIHRDIRFSKNKDPYKLHMAAHIVPGGRKSHAPGFYLHAGNKECMVGGGAYMLSKEQLYSIRKTIAAAPAECEELLRNKDFREKYGVLQGEKNKVVPAEFKQAARDYPLVANKQFYYMGAIEPTVFLSDDAPDILMEYYHAGRDVSEFFTRAMASG